MAIHVSMNFSFQGKILMSDRRSYNTWTRLEEVPDFERKIWPSIASPEAAWPRQYFIASTSRLNGFCVIALTLVWA